MNIRKMIATLAVAVLLIGTVSATAYPTYRGSCGLDLNPEIAVMGWGIADPEGEFEANPAKAVHRGWDLKLPFVTGSIYNPRETIFSGLNTIGEAIHPGAGKLVEMQTGVGFRVPYFGMTFSLEEAILTSSQPSVIGGFDKFVASESVAHIDMAGAGRIKFSVRSFLDIGVGLGLRARAFLDGFPVEDFEINHHEGTLLDYLVNKVPLMSAVEIPMKIGLQYNWNDIVCAGLVIRNEHLVTLGQMSFENAGDFKHQVKDDPLSFFGNEVTQQFIDWTIDLGFSVQDSKAVWGSRLGYRLSADLIDIVGLIRHPDDWAGHIRGGIEGTTEGCSFRAGFNRGPAVGLGMDLKVLKLDSMYRYVFFPEDGGDVYSQLTITASLGW